MPDQNPSPNSKPPKPGASVEERLAGFRRLMGSNSALLDEQKAYHDRSAKAAAQEIRTVSAAMEAIQAKAGTTEIDEADLERYEDLAKHKKELEQIELVSSEMIDRVHCGLEGNEYGGTSNGSGPGAGDKGKKGGGKVGGGDDNPGAPGNGGGLVGSSSASGRNAPKRGWEG